MLSGQEGASEPGSEHGTAFQNSVATSSEGVHMIRQIRHFLNISCFPNFRDQQGMSGPE